MHRLLAEEVPEGVNTKGTDMSTPPTKPLTDQQTKLIAAINRGVGDLRSLQEAAGYSSTSVVKYHLKLLAERGEIVMLRHGTQQRVYTGRDYARLRAGVGRCGPADGKRGRLNDKSMRNL